MLWSHDIRDYYLFSVVKLTSLIHKVVKLMMSPKANGNCSLANTEDMVLQNVQFYIRMILIQNDPNSKRKDSIPDCHINFNKKIQVLNC